MILSGEGFEKIMILSLFYFVVGLNVDGSGFYDFLIDSVCFVDEVGFEVIWILE